MKPINIKGYENYSITKDGRIFNTTDTRGNILDTPRELKSYPNKNTTYRTSVIRNNHIPKAVYIHRLVAEAYIEKPSDLHIEVNHKNLNKLDNRVENLEWVTKARNREHMHEIYGRLADTILRNEQLIRIGKKVYEITQDLQDVADIWNVNVALVTKILDEVGVDRKRYKQKLPTMQRNQLKQDVKDIIIHNRLNGIKIVFTKKLIEFLNIKYDTKFKRGYLDIIKDEVVNEINNETTTNEPKGRGLGVSRFGKFF
jgi:hypothetical protein